MARSYPLEQADSGIFTSAPVLFRYDVHYAAPPQRVWESLSSNDSVAAWGPSVKRVRWLSARPFGVGTTREVVLAADLARVRERFFRWDEGRGYSFAVIEANAPVFRRFAEDYVLVPDGDGTRFTWTVAIEPARGFGLPVRALRPLLEAAFGRVVADGKRYFGNRA
jgi:hypothetical protein